MYTFSKNDVISAVRKHSYFRVRVRVRDGVSGNTFSVKSVFDKSVSGVDPKVRVNLCLIGQNKQCNRTPATLYVHYK